MPPPDDPRDGRADEPWASGVRDEAWWWGQAGGRHAAEPDEPEHAAPVGDRPVAAPPADGQSSDAEPADVMPADVESPGAETGGTGPPGGAADPGPADPVRLRSAAPPLAEVPWPAAAPQDWPADAAEDHEAPYWVPLEEIPRGDVARETRPPRGRAERPQHRRPDRPLRRWREPRPAGGALAALVLLSLLAAFFGWVSAEPLLLAVGHGERGTATVTRCTGDGIAQRCTGRFTGTDGTVTEPVALRDVVAEHRLAGAAVTARMADRDSGQAYVGNDRLVLHLRWSVGLLLCLLCGAGIAWATGARRLPDRRARRWAVLGSLAGPLLLALGFVAAAW